MLKLNRFLNYCILKTLTNNNPTIEIKTFSAKNLNQLTVISMTHVECILISI